jgi:uncharacterized membrane protein
VRLDPLALLAILGMAAATYATRAGGLWLVSRVALSPRAEAWLRQIPGAVLAAIVAPAVFSGGPAEALAAAATALVAARTRNLLLAVAVGVGAVFVLRLLLAPAR